MRKLKKITLVVIIATICVASLAMSASALYISPDGRSGVNYLAVTNPTGATIGYRSVDSQGNMTVRNAVATAQGILYSYDTGTVTGAWYTNTGNPATSQIPATNWFIQLTGDNFARYCMPSRLYYGNAKVIAYVQLLNGQIITYETEAKLTFQWGQQTDGFHAVQFTADQINQTAGSFMYFDFDIPETINGEYVMGVIPYGTHVTKILLLQDNPSNYTGESGVTTWYVPFNEAYFTGVDNNEYYNLGYIEGHENGYEAGYNVGVDEGFSQGAEAAGGEPIQKWGAFLITAVDGFLSFEIFPGFTLKGLLLACLVIPLALVFLKLFAGG